MPGVGRPLARCGDSRLSYIPRLCHVHAYYSLNRPPASRDCKKDVALTKDMYMKEFEHHSQSRSTPRDPSLLEGVGVPHVVRNVALEQVAELLCQDVQVLHVRGLVQQNRLRALHRAIDNGRAERCT